jgi:hypothetical protein
MSVIAVQKTVTDGVTQICFASDSIPLDGLHHPSGKTKTPTKILRRNSLTIGCTGKYQDFLLLKEFVKTHKHPSDSSISAVLAYSNFFNSWAYEKFSVSPCESRFLIAYQDKIYRYEGEEFGLYEIEDFDAIGTGEDFARTALFLGLTPVRAVNIACKLSTTCVLPVESVTHSWQDTRMLLTHQNDPSEDGFKDVGRSKFVYNNIPLAPEGSPIIHGIPKSPIADGVLVTRGNTAAPQLFNSYGP